MKYFKVLFLELMATNFSPSSGSSYVLNKFPSISQWSDIGPSWPSCPHIYSLWYYYYLSVVPRSRHSVKVTVNYGGHIFHKKPSAIIFWMVSDRALIFQMCIPCNRTFLGYQGQCHLSGSRSNAKVTLSTKNFNIGSMFSLTSGKALAFRMCIFWGKTFSLVPKSSPVKFKVKYQGHIFQKS